MLTANMKTYIIAYQLGLSEINYQNMVAYVKSFTKWAHPMANIWIVKSSFGAGEIRDGFKKRINEADRVLVIEASKNHWATKNISKEVTDWMRRNLDDDTF